MSTDLLERRAASAAQPEHVEESQPDGDALASLEAEMEASGDPAGLSSRARRAVRWGTVALALAWTYLWMVPGIDALLTETALGSGAYGESVQTFEVFEMMFVGGYYVSRWVPGVAAIVLAGFLVGRRLERHERERQAS